MKLISQNLPDGTLATLYFCGDCKTLHVVVGEGEGNLLDARWTPLRGLGVLSIDADTRKKVEFYRPSFPALADFCAAYWSDCTEERILDAEDSVAEQVDCLVADALDKGFKA